MGHAVGSVESLDPSKEKDGGLGLRGYENGHDCLLSEGVRSDLEETDAVVPKYEVIGETKTNSFQEQTQQVYDDSRNAENEFALEKVELDLPKSNEAIRAEVSIEDTGGAGVGREIMKKSEDENKNTLPASTSLNGDDKGSPVEHGSTDKYPFLELSFNDMTQPPHIEDQIAVDIMTLIDRKSFILFEKLQKLLEIQKKSVNSVLDARNGVIKLDNKFGLKAFLVAIGKHKPQKPPAQERKIMKAKKNKSRQNKSMEAFDPTPSTSTSPVAVTKKHSPRKESHPSYQTHFDIFEDNDTKERRSPLNKSPSPTRVKSSSSRRSILPPKRYSEDEVILLDNEPNNAGKRPRKSKLRPNTFEIGMLPPKYPKQSESSPSSASSAKSKRKEDNKIEPSTVEEDAEQALGLNSMMELDTMEYDGENSIHAIREVEGESLFQISALFQSQDFQMQMMKNQHQALPQAKGHVQMDQHKTEEEIEVFVHDDHISSAPEDGYTIQCTKCLCVFQLMGVYSESPDKWVDFVCQECSSYVEKTVPQLKPIKKPNPKDFLRDYRRETIHQPHLQKNMIDEEQLVMPPPPAPPVWATPRSSKGRPRGSGRRPGRPSPLRMPTSQQEELELGLGVRLPPQTTLTRVTKSEGSEQQSQPQSQQPGPFVSLAVLNRAREQLEKQGYKVRTVQRRVSTEESGANQNRNSIPFPSYPVEVPGYPPMNVKRPGSSTFVFPPIIQNNGVPFPKLPKLRKTAAKTTSILDTPRITLVPKDSKRKHGSSSHHKLIKGHNFNTAMSSKPIEIPVLSGETFATQQQQQQFSQIQFHPQIAFSNGMISMQPTAGHRSQSKSIMNPHPMTFLPPVSSHSNSPPLNLSTSRLRKQQHNSPLPGVPNVGNGSEDPLKFTRLIQQLKSVSSKKQNVSLKREGGQMYVLPMIPKPPTLTSVPFQPLRSPSTNPAFSSPVNFNADTLIMTIPSENKSLVQNFLKNNGGKIQFRMDE